MRVSRHAEIIITRTQLEARRTERDTGGRKREEWEREERKGRQKESTSEEETVYGRWRVNVIMENISRARDTSGETRGKQSAY